MNAATCGVYPVHANMFFSDAAYYNINYSKISNTGLIQGVTKWKEHIQHGKTLMTTVDQLKQAVWHKVLSLHIKWSPEWWKI